MQNLYTPTEFENNPGTGTGNGVSVGVPPPDQPFDFSSGFARTRMNSSSTAMPRLQGTPWN